MKKRLLVVDDDSDILEVLQMRLAAMGFEVTATADPEEAVKAIRDGRFDLAIVDLRMEPIDGLVLTETIRGHQPTLPVIIMTAHGTIETAVDAVRRGAFDYLTKPFIQEELRRKIRQALSVRRWAHDRERLLWVGKILASAGSSQRVFNAVAQAAIETIQAERCVVFLRERERLLPLGRAGPSAPSWQAFEAAASLAMTSDGPTTVGRPDGHLLVAAPLVVQRGPAGALVIETPVEPSDDDLELLALFSSQAAVAIQNADDLERLRGGALTALGRLTAQVAHELKNPLAGVLVYVRYLAHRLNETGDSEGSVIVSKIRAAVEHLNAVALAITAFGRPTELHRVPTALHALLDECIELARARHPDEWIEVVRAYDAACPQTLLDPRELRKAFLNLVLNALEALEPGGRLTVGTGYDPTTRSVEVTVEDTGVGMSEETLVRAFDMFFTTKADGTGLGMAIARSVITMHGGELRIESAPGQGTRVFVCLPVEPPPEVAETRGPLALEWEEAS